jgi:hypothetical protein
VKTFDAEAFTEIGPVRVFPAGSRDQLDLTATKLAPELPQLGDIRHE